MAVNCSRCGVKRPFLSALNADIGAPSNAPWMCSDCDFVTTNERHDAERKRVAEIRAAAIDVIVTTTPKVDGYYAVKYLGIESVEYVIGTAIFSEFTSGVADFFGMRSSAFEKKMQAAKQTALDGLKYRAAEQGANAVIGVDIDYTEFTGNRVAIILSGTLVKLAPIPPRKV